MVQICTSFSALQSCSGWSLATFLFYFVLHSAFCVLQTQQDTISFRLWNMKMCERLLLGVCITLFEIYHTCACSGGIRMVSNARLCVCWTAGSILPASWSEAAWNRCATLEGIRLAVLFFETDLET